MKKVLIFVLCAALCLAFVSCGTPAVEEAVFTDAPEGSVEAAANDIAKLLESLKAGDAETIISLSGSDAAREDDLLLEMLVALFGQLEFKVGTPVVTDENNATVPVEIKAVSITSVFTEYMVEAAKHIAEENWDEDGKEFIKICNSAKVSKDTVTVDVALERGADGTWGRGANNEAFINALFGGLL